MKGRCALCNNNFFTRLDRHQLRKHNIVTSQKTPNLRQQVQEDPDMSRLPPHEDGEEQWEDMEEEELEEEVEEKQEKGREEEGVGKKYGALTLGSYPHYFYLKQEFLEDRLPKDRHYIDMDEQCLQLAHFLHKRDVKHWLKCNSNPMTLMALARCIHMLAYPMTLQPAHMPVFEADIYNEAKKRLPNRYKRFGKLNDQMDRIINQFRLLFLKYHDLIKKQLLNYSWVYK